MPSQSSVCAWRRLFILVLAFGSAVSNLAAAAVPALSVGSGSFVFADDRGNVEKPITVWYHRPVVVNSKSPIVFVMHGVRRDGREYRDAWAPLAEQRKFILVCPQFAEPDYPSRAYQLGNVLDKSKALLPNEKWTFSAIEHLFDAVKTAAGNQTERYYLYGHSAGAQFVHRLVLLLPEARYARAVAANPGWYTLPDFEQPYPYGLKGSGAPPEALGAAMGREFILLLGTEDTNANDENLNQSPQAEAQGKTRLERGQNFMRRSTEAAAALGVRLRWHSETVAGAGHSNRQMETAAANAFFAHTPR